MAKEHRRDTRGVIYFLLAHDVSRVKVGFTTHFENRFRDLQSASPVKLEVLRVVEGSYHDEQTVMAVFHKYRLHGEWFIAAPPLMQFINSLVQGEKFSIEQIALAK